MSEVCEFCKHGFDHPDSGLNVRVCKRYPPTWQFLSYDEPGQTGIVGLAGTQGKTIIQRKSAQPSVESGDTCGEFKRDKKKMS